jgi:hypothetical protein
LVRRNTMVMSARDALNVRSTDAPHNRIPAFPHPASSDRAKRAARTRERRRARIVAQRKRRACDEGAATRTLESPLTSSFFQVPLQ